MSMITSSVSLCYDLNVAYSIHLPGPTLNREISPAESRELKKSFSLLDNIGKTIKTHI